MVNFTLSLRLQNNPSCDRVTPFINPLLAPRFQVRNLDPFNHVYLPTCFLLNSVEVSSQEGTIIEGPFRKAHMINLHTREEEVAMSGIMTGRSLQASYDDN